MSRRDSKAGNDARLQDVLAEASQLDGNARQAYLDEACAGNPALRAEVESLLGAVDADPAFMAEPTVAARPAVAGDAMPPPSHLVSGERLVDRRAADAMATAALVG